MYSEQPDELQDAGIQAWADHLAAKEQELDRRELKLKTQRDQMIQILGDHVNNITLNPKG